MNEEVKKIFSIEVNNEFDKKVLDTYTHALKKYACIKMDDETIINRPFDPGIAMIACKPVEDYVNFDNPKWWIPYAIKELDKHFDSFNKNIVLNYKENTPEDDALILRSKYLLGKSWKEGLEQIELFVSDILIFESNGLYNSATPWAFGALFLAYKPGINAVEMIDYLVHEQGHLALDAKLGFGKILLNENDTAYSPIRKEYRPLLGVLHAIFVCSRVCEALSRLKVVESELSIEEKQRANQLYQENLSAFKESLQNIDGVAQYTEIGDYFMSQLREKLMKLEKTETIFNC